MKKIQISNGKYAIVDDEDYPLLSRHKWYPHDPDGYATCHHGIKMHWLIKPPPVGYITDHINRNRLDNRKCNLRHISISENSWNRNPNVRGKSQYKGVQWEKNMKKWKARIIHNGKTIYVGLHKTEKAAALAYDAAVRILRKKYAFVNFPKEYYEGLSSKKIRQLELCRDG